MFKKIAIASVLFATSTTMAFASSAPYVGAALGVNTVTNNVGNYRGVPLNIFAGYGATINTNLYLGGEVFIVPFNGMLSRSYFTNLRTTYSYGASILPGFMFSDHTLGYVRAGVVGSHFSSPGRTKTGGQLGLGMQTNVAQNLDLRTEYVFTAYKNTGSTKSDAFNLGLVYKFE